MTAVECAVLSALLSHDVAGVEPLRDQSRRLLVRRGCRCGCGTIDFVPQSVDPPRSDLSGWFPVSGHVLDGDGNVIGGVIAFVDDGVLSTLEVHGFDDALAMPRVENVEWQL